MERTYCYDIVYITSIPSFYKINLINKIAEKKSILVIFLKDSDKDRNNDFYKGERNFEFISLGKYWMTGKTLKFISLLRSISYKRLIICGLDYKELWIAAFFCPKEKNAIVIESSIFESSTSGIKGFLKRKFINRISTSYVPGKAQKELVLELGFKGEIKITKGVGLFNLVKQPAYYPKEYIKNFIYVGRLSPEKNLDFLITVFNDLPQFKLNIIGFGPQEDYLKSISKSNVIFIGSIPNTELNNYYEDNDVLILPSLSETWGLVVEEAFNNGIPVIVSNKVGCSAEIVEIDKNGLIFNLEEKDGLKKAIFKISDPIYYNSLRKNVCKMDFEKIAEEQVKCYL
jgi:glycosyltransferase involved in cell wall biosynthesis